MARPTTALHIGSTCSTPLSAESLCDVRRCINLIDCFIDWIWPGYTARAMKLAYLFPSLSLSISLFLCLCLALSVSILRGLLQISLVQVSVLRPNSILLRATAGTAIARLSHRNSVCLSVRLSVRLSHGWIRQKRCKLGSSNLHRRLPQRL